MQHSFLSIKINTEEGGKVCIYTDKKLLGLNIEIQGRGVRYADKIVGIGENIRWSLGMGVIFNG